MPPTNDREVDPEHVSTVFDARILMNEENLARVAEVAWITDAELTEANEMAALDVGLRWPAPRRGIEIADQRDPA